MPTARPCREIDEALSRSLLLGLRWEYERALPKAPTSIGRRVAPPPNILLADIRKLGTADPETWTIRINADFAAARRFDDVRDVFLHEVAHLWASVHPKGRAETSHGPVFRFLCEVLGADPAAAARAGPLCGLHGGSRDGGSDPLDRLRARVRKLLSLARSPYPEEARAAASKASELIARYNLSLVEEGRARAFTSRFMCDPARRHPRHIFLISNILQRFFFVEAVWVPAWVVPKACTGSVPEISGQPHDVELALYVFDFIRGTTRAQWGPARQTRGFSGREFQQFALGVAAGFYSKLEEDRRRLAERIRAEKRAEAPALSRPGGVATDLMDIADPELKAYVRRRYGRLRSIGWPGLPRRSSYYAGRKVGRNMVLHRGVASTAGASTALMLPE